MIKIYKLLIAAFIIGFFANPFEAFAQNVVINEIMASNDTIVADEAGEYDDWIELYNNSDAEIDLSGYYLSDKVDNPTKWTFPEGTKIEGDGYLILWADEDSIQGPLHTNFKLSAAGETLLLLDKDLLVLDQLTYGEQPTDTSYARSPNGTGNFVNQLATFGSDNDVVIPIGIFEYEVITLHLYPNPTNEFLFIGIIDQQYGNPISVTNSIGQVIWSGKAVQGLQINVSDWATGLYFVQMGNQTRKLIVRD